MLAWLDAHAGAIQALGSLATLAVTGILARFTARYVRLTKSIADSAVQQAQLTKTIADAALEQASIQRATILSSRDRTREALHAQARRLRTSVQVLAVSEPHFDQLHRFALISDDDILQLQALAKDNGGTVQQDAATAATALRHLVGLAAKLAKINPNMGWAPDAAETRDYATARSDAVRSLAGIEAEVQVPPRD